MTEKLKELINKKQLLKQLQDEIKELEKELVDKIEEETVDNYKVKRVSRISFKLKPDVDIEELIEKYPEATKLQIDTKALSKSPEGQKYLEVDETAYLKITEIKG